MKRRTVIKTAGGAGVVGSSVLGGCLDTVTPLGTSYRWRYDGGGAVDAVVDGIVFGREMGGRSGWNAVALDAETGERRWTYGAGGMGSHTELTVRDGIYFGWCGDTACGDLSALEPDGEERWTRTIDIDRLPRPFIADGVVYVGSDGFVRALDAATGERRWTSQERVSTHEAIDPIVVDVTDAVYVRTDHTRSGTNHSLVAFDRDEGSTLWRYDTGEEPAIDATISNDIVYVSSRDWVAAVADGDELWRRDFAESGVDVGSEMKGVASGQLFVEHGPREEASRLYAFDITTGEQTWVSDATDSDWSVAFHDGVVYSGTDKLRALDAATGSERWRAAVDGGQVEAVTLEAGVEEEYAIFVKSTTQLTSFAPDGKRTWSESVGEEIGRYLVDQLVFVSTEEGIYALDRRPAP